MRKISDLLIVVKYEEKYFLPDRFNNVFTEFYLRFDNSCFPCVGWTDFPCIVLQWWANELLKMRYLEKYTAKLYFMDGPFRLELFKDEKMNLDVYGVNSRGKNEIKELIVKCNYYDFLQALLHAINDLIHTLHFVFPDKQAEKSFRPHFSELAKQIRRILSEYN
jgi:hypothetical protein